MSVLASIWFNPSHWSHGAIVLYLVLCAVAIGGGALTGRVIRARRGKR